MKKLLLIGLILSVLSCNVDLGGDEIPSNIPTSNVITGTINTTTTLTSDREWILKGYVYITDGATLKIQPGTIIKSDVSEKGALCIERGAKIDAQGTELKPIIFTSGKPEGERSPGDWGGIILLGRAKTNRLTEPTIEGGIGRPYGGNDDTDNSGIMKYVRIEYAGVAAMPNSEINALTFGGVGSGTVIENIQTIYANDDAFEFFGGTVSPKNLYAYATADDDFDFDFGYRGTITNGIAKRVPDFVDSGDAGNGVECDNDGSGSPAIPTTHPILNNMILIGPNSSESLPNHNLGLRFRRGSQFTMKNSIIFGWMKGGLSLESVETAQYLKDGISVFENNQVGSFNPSTNFISKVGNVITNDELKTLALSKNNKEIDSIIESITKPEWSNGWTKFPKLGF